MWFVDTRLVCVALLIGVCGVLFWLRFLVACVVFSCHYFGCLIRVVWCVMIVACCVLCVVCCLSCCVRGVLLSADWCWRLLMVCCGERCLLLF